MRTTGSESVRNIAVHPDGGYVLLGNWTNVNNQDIFLAKTDNSLNPIWIKAYSPTGVNDEASWESLLLTADGGFFFMGNDVNASHSYLFKTDSLGNLLWSHITNGSGLEYLNSAILTSDGGFACIGKATNLGFGDWDINFIKTDANGLSGCVQNSFNPVVSSPSFTITTPTTITGSGGIESNPLTLERCLNIQDSTLCLDNPTNISSSSVTICEGDSALAGGSYQTATGQYYDTLIAATGCDSILCTYINVLMAFDSTINVTICSGDSFFAGGAYQNTPGTYYDILPTSGSCSCDSLVTTILSLVPNYSFNVDVTICMGDSIYAAGSYQSSAGIYYDSLLAVDGCDSVIITNLTVDLAFSDTSIIYLCLGDSVLIGGIYYDSSGIHYDTLPTVSGCDSIFVTILELVPYFVTNISETICEFDTLWVGTNGYYQTGIHSDTLLSLKWM